MISKIAKQEDFARWQSQSKKLSISSLRFTIKDCHEAAEAMKGWNFENEGYYLDQMATFAQELAKRVKAEGNA